MVSKKHAASPLLQDKLVNPLLASFIVTDDGWLVD
jgi:hypothetical protein